MKIFSDKPRLGIIALALILSLPYFASSSAFAQEDDATTNPPANDQAQANGDGNLISRLNLTPEQIKQIREIRQSNALAMRESRQRMGRAQMELDEAIYADSVDEADIEARARDLATAQVAVARLRALTELRIRRVLTPEQLQILRGIRREARQQNRERTRGLRQNPSAFQERRRSANPGSNQGGAKSGTPSNPQETVKPANRRP